VQSRSGAVSMVKKEYKGRSIYREDELDTTILLIELHEKLDKIIELLEKKKGGSTQHDHNNV